MYELMAQNGLPGRAKIEEAVQAGHLPDIYAPVSYTHLDVYKRQVIHPKHQVLPLLRGHFCSRLPDEDFLIFDATHGTALVRRGGQVQYLSLIHISGPRSPQ